MNEFIRACDLILKLFIVFFFYVIADNSLRIEKNIERLADNGVTFSIDKSDVRRSDD